MSLFTSFSALFTLDRETKRTFRYTQVNSIGTVLDSADASIGSLYIKKKSLPSPPPSQIKVTIEEVL